MHRTAKVFYHSILSTIIVPRTLISLTDGPFQGSAHQYIKYSLAGAITWYYKWLILHHTPTCGLATPSCSPWCLWVPLVYHSPNTDACHRITFTYGGISINMQGHALTWDKNIIPGLLVAGVDVGCFSNLGYAGSLVLTFATSLWSAWVVLCELGLPELCPCCWC